MICSCYDHDLRRPLCYQPKIRGGGPWGSICDINGLDKDAEMLIRNGIRNLEGDGCNTLFWKDLWLREIRLKDKFPRLFSISLLKNSPISECGAWDDCVWH